MSAVASTPLDKTGNRPVILLAEDEAMVRSVVGHMLRKLGYRVMTAVDGKEAVELLTSHHTQIDLVIFDMAMPEMDGEELFENIKRIAPDVKTLLTSGFHERGVVEAMQHKGLSGVLAKPFDLRDMRGKLIDIMEPKCGSS